MCVCITGQFYALVVHTYSSYVTLIGVDEMHGRVHIDNWLLDNYVCQQTHTYTIGVTLVLVASLTGDSTTTVLEGQPGSLTRGSSLTTTSIRALLQRYMYMYIAICVAISLCIVQSVLAIIE